MGRKSLVWSVLLVLYGTSIIGVSTLLSSVEEVHELTYSRNSANVRDGLSVSRQRREAGIPIDNDKDRTNSSFLNITSTSQSGSDFTNATTIKPAVTQPTGKTVARPTPILQTTVPTAAAAGNETSNSTVVISTFSPLNSTIQNTTASQNESGHFTTSKQTSVQVQNISTTVPVTTIQTTEQNNGSMHNGSTTPATTSQGNATSDTSSHASTVTTITPDPDTANTTVETDDRKYYEVQYVTDSDQARALFIDITRDGIEHPALTGNRLALQLRASWYFQYYGHQINHFTVTTGGFLYMDEFLHQHLTATQYVAPLMANFHNPSSDDPNASNGVLYAINSEKFIVQWNELELQDQPELGKFTFQVQLHRNDGQIVFAYKQIPSPVSEISNRSHSVKVGVADAYYYDYGLFRTIFEYHNISVPFDKVSTDSAIIFKHQTTCNMLSDCESCHNANLTHFTCYWCEDINRCSDTRDRGRQFWVYNQCPRNEQTKETCPVTSTSSLQSSTSPSVSTSKPTTPPSSTAKPLNPSPTSTSMKTSKQPSTSLETSSLGLANCSIMTTLASELTTLKTITTLQSTTPTTTLGSTATNRTDKGASTTPLTTAGTASSVSSMQPSTENTRLPNPNKTPSPPTPTTTVKNHLPLTKPTPVTGQTPLSGSSVSTGPQATTVSSNKPDHVSTAEGSPITQHTQRIPLITEAEVF